jgi:hypothetical protein
MDRFVNSSGGWPDIPINVDVVRRMVEEVFLG